jgi:membrane protease YdiL (CAAX protease family)
MTAFSSICSLILAIYVGYQSAVGAAKYRRLKLAISQGDAGARARFYVEILIFEGVSAALAFAALGFDPARFDPARLGLAETAFGQWCAAQWQQLDAEALKGLVIGVLCGSAVMFALLWRARRRNPQASLSATSPLARILPDFGALVPTNARERMIFALVALSAGLCEEVVFRAWLLDVLHRIDLGGLALVATAAAIFGLAHVYQGVVGVVITGVLGAVFCALYFASGTLWLPIAIHALIDLRVAVMPSFALAPKTLPQHTPVGAAPAAASGRPREEV